MPTVAAWTLWVHIAAGVVAVLGGTGALVTKKGGQRHRQAGTLFVLSMGVVVGTVFMLLALNPTSFRIILTLVAVFSGYLAFSGYRVLSRKRPAAAPQRLDWIATVSVVLACLGLGGWGIVWLTAGNSFGLVMLVFGGIGVTFGMVDIRIFRGETSSEWLVSHLQRMIAAFIATISAVSAVNLSPVLGMLAWLWPTIVGTPLIYYWSKKHSTE